MSDLYDLVESMRPKTLRQKKQALLSRFLSGLGSSYFDPRTLFARGEVGAWYDPSDLSSMAQNSDGSVAAVVGQPVGYIADKSGNGKHATQATTGNKPTLRQSGSYYYLEFDGTDDWLETAAVDFSATDKMSVFAGVQCNSSAAAGTVVTLGGKYAAPGFIHQTPYNVGDTTSFDLDGPTGLITRAARSASPFKYTGSWVMDRAQAAAADKSNVWVNKTKLAISNTNTPAGNFASGVLYLGTSPGDLFNGNIYSLIVRGALSDAAQIAAAEMYVNSKTGAYS